MDSCLRFSRRFFLLASLAATAAFAQTTIRVPADVPTIQGAISSANNGDTVLVSPGTYFESINFLGKAITVTSTDGAATTIIDVDGLACCVSGVTFSSSETSASVLNGFTVQNANGTPPQAGPGYGVNIIGSSPTITSNIITNNRGGGGINIASGSPQILNNTITNNYGIYGGGIFVNGTASALVQNNLISGNSASNGGGGVAVQSYGFPTQFPSTIQQNLIINNTSFQGAGVFVQGTNPQMINNTLFGNSSSQSDSGIFIDYSSGGFPAPGAVVENNVVMVSSGYAISCGSDDPSVIYSHNLGSTGSITSWNPNCGVAPGTNGNVDGDPRFLDAINGNFHLTPGSPAIDAGDITFPSLPAFDYAGAARLGDDSGQCSFVIDMGVYQSHSAAPGTITISSSSLGFPDTAIGNSSPPQPISLNSTGQGCFRVAGFNVAGDFTQTNSCGSGVPAGQSCTVYAAFAPTAIGLRSGFLSVLMNTNPGTAPAPVALTGNGLTGAVLVYSPNNLSFPDQNLRTSSTSQSITLSNTGGGAYALSQFNITGPGFAQTNNCPASIAPGASCTINVVFSPATPVLFSATLTAMGFPAGVGGSVGLNGTGIASFAAVSPNALTFPLQRIGSVSPAQVVTISNNGTAALAISSITTTGATAFAQINNCPASLAVGSSCSLNITFMPAQVGTFTGSVIVTDDSNAVSGSTQAISLIATGATSVANVSPSVLTFAATNVGANSASSAVTISNSGNLPLNINSISVSGDFTQSNNCGSSVARGSSCLVNVTFAPTAIGTRNGTLTISDDSQTGTSQTTSLSGTGNAALASLSSNTLTFAMQRTGTTSAAQVVTLSNTGNLPLAIDVIEINGANSFSETNNCPASIPVGSSCSINVTFHPTFDFTFNASLDVADNSGGGPGAFSLQHVLLFGSSGSPVGVPSPSILTFAATNVGTSSATAAVTVTNYGTMILNMGSISITGDFSQSNDCGSSIAAGASCVVNVTFTPVAAGSRTGTLTINDDSADGTTQTVSLSGTGNTPASASVSPSSLTFAATNVATSSTSVPVTITNSGTISLNISSISITGDFSQSNNCGTSVAGGSSCVVNVTFTPTAAGTRTGTLTMNDNSQTGSTQAVSLSGVGTAPLASLSSSSLIFATQRLGSTSTAQVVTLSNTGTAALGISSIATTGATAFAQTNNCPASLTVGTSCSINISFGPTQVATFNGNVVITDNSGGTSGRTQSISLSGAGGTSAASVSPSSLTFSSTKVGTSSASSAVTINNSGTMPLNVSSISTSGDFSQSNNCGVSVAAGGSCVVNVIFSPGAVGSRTGTLTINDDSQNGAVQTVSLAGTGAVPTVSVAPTSLTFLTTATGTQSASSPVTVHNTGTVAMNVTSIVTSGDFGQTNNCSLSLAAGASCTINVSFAPTASGTRTGTLTITDDALGGSQTVSLSGPSTDFSLTVSPTSVSINAGQSTTFNAKVSAVGGTYNQSVSFLCSGLPAGASCTFNPTSVIPGSTSKNTQAKIVTSTGTPKGTYTIVITGVVNNISRSTSATLIVK